MTINHYKPTQNQINQIFSYTAPCSFDEESLILKQEDQDHFQLILTAFFKKETVLSLFVNVVEQESCTFNLTQNLIIAKHNSFQKHVRIPECKDK